jgi:hypothetical protein
MRIVRNTLMPVISVVIRVDTRNNSQVANIQVVRSTYGAFCINRVYRGSQLMAYRLYMRGT